MCTAANAKAPRFYTRDDDGLSQPWEGRIWLNPPYGREIGSWLRRAAQAGAEGHLIVALVPARSTGTQWWIEATAAASLPPRFIPRRLVNPETGRQWTIPAAILVFGPVRGRHGTEARGARCAGSGSGLRPPKRRHVLRAVPEGGLPSQVCPRFKLGNGTARGPERRTGSPGRCLLLSINLAIPLTL